MNARVLSLSVIVSPPFTDEGKTSDIFQTYPMNIITNNCMHLKEIVKKIIKKLGFNPSFFYLIIITAIIPTNITNNDIINMIAVELAIPSFSGIINFNL